MHGDVGAVVVVADGGPEGGAVELGEGHDAFCCAVAYEICL